MIVSLAAVSAFLVSLHVAFYLFRRFWVAPRMPIGADGYSLPWVGQDGRTYHMNLRTGQIVQVSA